MMRRSNKKKPLPLSSLSNYQSISLKAGDKVEVMRSRPVRAEEANMSQPLMGKVTKFDRVTGKVYIKELPMTVIKKAIRKLGPQQPGKFDSKIRGIHISNLWYIKDDGARLKISAVKKYLKDEKMKKREAAQNTNNPQDINNSQETTNPQD